MTSTSYLPIALRAYTERASPKPERSHRSRQRPAATRARYVLVVDTETTTDATQRLNFGSYRYYRVRGHRHRPTTACVEEGLFYAEDLRDRDPQGFAILREYAATHRADVAPGVDRRLRLRTCTEFLDKVLYRAAYKVRVTVVSFNLPFDLSRLAWRVGEARGRFEGGFSLALWRYQDKRGVWHESRYRPRIAIKTIDSKRALKGFTRPARVDGEDRIPDGEHGQADPASAFRGHFLDLRTLAFALTDEGHSLESACKAFGVAHGKATVREHGRLTPEYIKYNRGDTRASAELYVRLMQEYAKHPIDVQPTKAYSPASIGKAYLRAMGIRPILERQPDFPKDVLGYAMTAYFGGRAECRARRVPVPVVPLDFQSMYPTVCGLMGIFRFLTCERIEVEDATDEVRVLLSQFTPEDGFDPENWKRWVGLVRILPEDDVLSVRAPYAEGASRQIGVNPLTSREPVWVTIPEAIASKLLTGKPPTVLRAIRFVPQGVNPDLRPVALRGAISVDPRTQDFFTMAVEERQRIKRQRGHDEPERTRLERFLKVLVNATSYGISAEMLRHELPAGKREAVTVYGLDPTSFIVKVAAPEEPGAFAFPPIAACVTGAARLMLALLECPVTQAGGTSAFCDTDSMAVVATEAGGLIPCPSGPERLPDGREAVRALSWAEVETIRERFATLNPYSRDAVPGSILKLEKENFDEVTDERRQLYCYSISAKRYALFNLDQIGRPILRDCKEHGLGHLLNPADPNNDSRDWIRTLWEGIVTEALGQPYRWPDWLTRPAVGRITVSHPSLRRLFEGLNRGKPYAEQVKPYNFLLTAFVAAFGHPADSDPEGFHLIAPWNPDARQWLKIAWTDRSSGRRYVITTAGTGGEGAVRVKTYGDVLAEYRVHPEPKSLGPDGEPCGRATRGLLRRRPVKAVHITYIGKESNKLEDVEAGVVHDSDEVLTEYADPRRDPFRTLVLPMLRDLPATRIAETVSLHPSTAKRIRSGRSVAHSRHRASLVALAAGIARDRLINLGISPPDDDFACCQRYLEERDRRPLRACSVCGASIVRGRSRYCSLACKQSAYRARRSRLLRRISTLEGCTHDRARTPSAVHV